MVFIYKTAKFTPVWTTIHKIRATFVHRTVTEHVLYLLQISHSKLSNLTLMHLCHFKTFSGCCCFGTNPLQTNSFVAVKQRERSNIPKEKNQERECRARVKTPLIQSTSGILIA